MLTDRGIPWSTLPIPERHSDLNEWHATNRVRWREVVRTTALLASCHLHEPLPPPSVA